MAKCTCSLSCMSKNSDSLSQCAGVDTGGGSLQARRQQAEWVGALFDKVDLMS